MNKVRKFLPCFIFKKMILPWFQKKVKLFAHKKIKSFEVYSSSLWYGMTSSWKSWRWCMALTGIFCSLVWLQKSIMFSSEDNSYVAVESNKAEAFSSSSISWKYSDVNASLISMQSSSESSSDKINGFLGGFENKWPFFESHIPILTISGKLSWQNLVIPAFLQNSSKNNYENIFV